MHSRRARLLCVGNERDHLQSRCDVLNFSGYDAKSATVRQAEILLRTEKFALVIVSAFLSQAERERVVSAAGETPTLVLEGLTFAPQLLPQVERLLQPIHLNL